MRGVNYYLRHKKKEVADETIEVHIGKQVRIRGKGLCFVCAIPPEEIRKVTSEYEVINDFDEVCSVPYFRTYVLKCVDKVVLDKVGKKFY